MVDRLAFLRRSFVRGWQQLIEIKDHLELVWFLIVALLTIIGASTVAAFLEQAEWIPPTVLAGVVITVLVEGAYAEWKDVDVAAKSYQSGLPLELSAADPINRGGRIHTPLRVKNPNDQPIPECYVRVVSCEADTDRQEYAGPPDGYHYPWSTYEGEALEPSPQSGGGARQFLISPSALARTQNAMFRISTRSPSRSSLISRCFVEGIASCSKRDPRRRQ